MDNSNRHILLVDDDLSIKVLVETFLKNLPITVHHVKNGFDALSTTQDKSIELIILDISMPIMSGSTFLKKLRSSEDYKDTPVIILTSSDDKDQVLKFINMKISDYLIKPPSKETFVKKVKASLLLE